ncbi:MAG: FliM/FliN family flagellar motor switch protein [Terriglobales bacterium]
MTASSPQPAPDREVHEYMKVWASSMSQMLTQIAGAAFGVELLLVAPPDAPAAGEHDVQVAIVAAGSLRGEMGLRVPRITELALGQLFLHQPQDAAAETKPDHHDAVQELLRQITGQVATALSSRGGETQLRVESAPSPTWSTGAAGWLVSAAGAPCRVFLEWQFSSALIAALRGVPGKEPASAPAQASEPAANQLDLLMDVELDVILRFGQRSLTLREIMELDAGSIVELDRLVQEPADLLLEGRVIARGEVVVMDGNYGLRVLEVVSLPDKR